MLERWQRTWPNDPALDDNHRKRNELPTSKAAEKTEWASAIRWGAWFGSGRGGGREGRAIASGLAANPNQHRLGVLGSQDIELVKSYLRSAQGKLPDTAQ